MWRRLWAILKGIIFLAGLVGFVTLPEDAEKWAKLVGPLADYVSLDRVEFALYAAIIVFGLWILLPVATPFLAEIRRFFRQTENDGLVEQGTSPKAISEEERMATLVAGLKEYANEYSNSKILFANVKFLPLAKTLNSAFEAAGWKADLTNFPQENHPPRYIEGVQVTARNKALLDVVCKLLEESGVSSVEPNYEEMNYKLHPNKHHPVLNCITIMIGHH